MDENLKCNAKNSALTNLVLNVFSLTQQGKLYIEIVIKGFVECNT